MDVQEKMKLIAELERQAEQLAVGAKALAAELGVEVTNERAARELIWLVEQCGKEAVADAVACLPGGRRAYPLNVARVLMVKKMEIGAGPAVRAELHKVMLKGHLQGVEREAAEARHAGRGRGRAQ